MRQARVKTRDQSKQENILQKGQRQHSKDISKVQIREAKTQGVQGKQEEKTLEQRHIVEHEEKAKKEGSKWTAHGRFNKTWV